MKKIFLILVIISGTVNIHAQWLADMRFTFNPAVSITPFNYKSIAADGPPQSEVHAVWYDDRDGNFEIYYKRSPDQGLSWGPDTRLTTSSGTSWFSTIAVSSPQVHVVWMDNRDGNYEIYYKRSADGGISWAADMRLTTDTSHSQFASITASGSVLNVIWQDARDGNTEIYNKRSVDGGLTWGSDIRLTNDTAASMFASISSADSIVNVSWEEYRDGNAEIYNKFSIDGGISWSTDMRLTNNPAESFSPSVSMSGTNINLVWYDTRDGNAEVYYKRSTDGGVTWGIDTRLTNNTSGSYHPSIIASGSNLHLVWYDERDGNREVYYKFSADAGISWGADTRLTNNLNESSHPSVAVQGLNVHLLWQDIRDGNWEIYYKRNPAGNPVGIMDNNIFSGEIDIFPNPGNGELSIKVPALSQVIITNTIGSEIFDAQLNSGLSAIRLNDPPSGIYFIRVYINNRQYVTKLVINNQ